MIDALRMALGTLTVLPVRAPRRIDSRIAGNAMLLAPLAVLPLAAACAALVYGSMLIELPALVSATLALGLLALGSRGLHLDGLADTADGLAASYDRQRALDVMRTSDSGPAGVATLLLVLLVQCAALSGAAAEGHGIAVAVAVLAGRSVLAMCCCRLVPSARGDGLGATVARAIHPAWAALAVVVVAGVSVPVVLLAGMAWWRAPLAVFAAAAVAIVVLLRCVRRFGGITGDVLGACVESATTTALLTLAA